MIMNSDGFEENWFELMRMKKEEGGRSKRKGRGALHSRKRYHWQRNSTTFLSRLIELRTTEMDEEGMYCTGKFLEVSYN